MQLALLLDFGSTYTKVTIVDLVAEEVVATARGRTTVESNIMDGLDRAMTEIHKQLGTAELNFKYKLGCSSAAGGLRIAAIGLVKDLTVEAAKQAALGAGARVLGVYAHELAIKEINEIELVKPDIVLLAGGTDGGNKEVLLHNASMLAESIIESTVIVAGNKSVADKVEQILTQAGKKVLVTENVLPQLDKLNVLPARNLIRQVFLDTIIEAKGLKKAEAFIERILMPTPAAVLNAAQLLATGYGNEKGLGELIVVDIGGATTDVHSLANGLPTKSGVNFRGLPQPFGKRTVEGDLGMRVSSLSLFESLPPGSLERYTQTSAEKVKQYIDDLQQDYSLLPRDEEEKRIETAMAAYCAGLAVERHAGVLEVVWTPFGASYVQTGKDLTEVPYVIGTGGVIANHPNPSDILKTVLFQEENPTILKPKQPEFLIDSQYLLASMGLLAEVEPEKTLRIMKKYINKR
ncbi:methylaspartate mutase accessory protein GlmL [Peptococcaceae bacterium 1198_IL3148]